MMESKRISMSLAEKIEKAIKDHIDRRKDTQGFSTLGLLCSELKGAGRTYHVDLELALQFLLPKFTKRDEWESICDIIYSSGLKSKKIQTSIITILNRWTKNEEQIETLAVYHAFTAYHLSGGTLRRPRLDNEIRLYNEYPAEWNDLVLLSYEGAPDAIISFLVEQVGGDRPRYTAKNIYFRLMMFSKILGNDFNRAMVRVLNSVKNEQDRQKINADIKAIFKISLLPDEQLEESNSGDIYINKATFVAKAFTPELNALKKRISALEDKIKVLSALQTSPSNTQYKIELHPYFSHTPYRSTSYNPGQPTITIAEITEKSNTVLTWQAFTNNGNTIQEKTQSLHALLFRMDNAGTKNLTNQTTIETQNGVLLMNSTLPKEAPQRESSNVKCYQSQTSRCKDDASAAGRHQNPSQTALDTSNRSQSIN
jgi:hypothetical protein